MQHVTSTQFRQQSSRFMSQVQDDHTPLLITTQKKGAVVMVSLGDWNALQETMYLMQSPANKNRLDRAVLDINDNRNLVYHSPAV